VHAAHTVAGRAPSCGPGALGAVLEVLAGDGPPKALKSLTVCQRDTAGAVHGNGLESLGAHHSAKASLPGCGALVSANGGDARQVLASGADGSDLSLGAQPMPQDLLGGHDPLAPQVRGIAQFGAVVVNPEVHRSRRLSGDDHAVIPRILEMVSHIAAHAAAREPRDWVALWRQRADGDPPRRRSTGAGQRAGQEHQRVLGVEGGELWS